MRPPHSRISGGRMTKRSDGAKLGQESLIGWLWKASSPLNGAKFTTAKKCSTKSCANLATKSVRYVPRRFHCAGEAGPARDRRLHCSRPSELLQQPAKSYSNRPSNDSEQKMLKGICDRSSRCAAGRPKISSRVPCPLDLKSVILPNIYPIDGDAAVVEVNGKEHQSDEHDQKARHKPKPYSRCAHWRFHGIRDPRPNAGSSSRRHLESALQHCESSAMA